MEKPDIRALVCAGMRTGDPESNHPTTPGFRKRWAELAKPNGADSLGFTCVQSKLYELNLLREQEKTQGRWRLGVHCFLSEEKPLKKPLVYCCILS